MYICSGKEHEHCACLYVFVYCVGYIIVLNKTELRRQNVLQRR
jgi:hypothetical protein